MITPESIDRLKSQLLVSGVQQQNQPLYQVINQLIDAVRASLVATGAITGTTSGGTAITDATYLTEDIEGGLPNSRQVIAGQNIQFNDAPGGRRVISALIPFPLDGESGEDGMIGPQGLSGIAGAQGAAGNAGMPGLDGEDGIDGEPGLMGPQGFTGSQGIQGVMGFQGLDGIDGEPGEEGIQGPQGIPGALGIQGIQGQKAGNIYNFDDSTVDSDPGVGNFRLDTATPDGTDFKIFINDVNANSIDVSVFIDTWDDIANSYLIITGNDNSTTTFFVVQIIGITDAVNYKKIDVTWIAGAFALIDGDTCSIQFSRTGATGPTGSAGGIGPIGPPGLDAEEPEIPYIIPGPQGPQGPAGGGGGSATTIEVNLGSTPTWRGKFTITDALITGASKILAWQAPGPYTGKGTRADEAELQPVSIIAVSPAAGSATVYWQTPPYLTSTKMPLMMQSTFTPFNPKDPQGIIYGVPTRLGKVRGNVKFTYMVM